MTGVINEAIYNLLYILILFNLFLNYSVTYNQRTANGWGGYILSNRSKTVFLDCFETAQQNECWASMANSPYGCRYANGAPVTHNARCIIFAEGNNHYTWSLKATKVIKKGQEILFNYGAGYIYPTHYGAAFL